MQTALLLLYGKLISIDPARYVPTPMKLESSRRFANRVLWVGRQVIFWGVCALAITFVGCSAKLALEGPPSWAKYQSMCERMQQPDVTLYPPGPSGYRECLSDFSRELETRSFFTFLGFAAGGGLLTTLSIIFVFRRRRSKIDQNPGS